MKLPIISGLLITIMVVFNTPTSLAGGVVTTCDEPSLRAALTDGGSLTFSSSGTIVLTNTLVITNDTLIDGAGHTVAISGNDSVRVFQVNPGIALTLLNLSVIQGRTNQGAGIFNNGGSVMASNCVFAGNAALGVHGTNGLGPNPASSGTPASGGAFYSIGSLIVLNSTFLTNQATGGNGGWVSSAEPGYLAVGEGAAGMGGAIYAVGVAGFTNCTFTQNRSQGGTGGSSTADISATIEGHGGEAAGGAVYATGYLNASNTVFSRNISTGGNAGTATVFGGRPGNSAGGAIFCNSSTNAFVNCSFEENSATAGYHNASKNYPPRGIGRGGAVCTVTSMVSFTSSQVSSNSVNGCPAYAGGVCQNGGTVTLSNASFIGNSSAAGKVSNYYGSDGSPGWGGGVYSDGFMAVTDSVFRTNQTSGGICYSYSGSSPWLFKGGTASGAGICSLGPLQLNRCTFAGNTAVGGLSDSTIWEPHGGTAYGGGVFCASNAASLVNCTLVGNTARGGGILLPAAGSGGDAFGGGLYAYASTASVTNCTQAGNQAIGALGSSSYNKGFGYGGNLAVGTGTVQLVNTILAAGVSTNVYGTITDLGHNLSSDGSCTFAGPGSMNNTDPKLAALGDNGGPTPTIALLAGSPAIDSAVSLPNINLDQRGIARPYGAAPDIGAYEWNATWFPARFSLSLIPGNGHCAVAIAGPANTTLRIQKSTSLMDWLDISTNSSGPGGTLVFEDDNSSGPAGFYRTISP